MSFEDDWADLRPKEKAPVEGSKRDLSCSSCGEPILNTQESEKERKRLTGCRVNPARVELKDGRAYHHKCFNRMNFRQGRVYTGRFYDAFCPTCDHWHVGDRSVVISADDHAICSQCCSDGDFYSTPTRVYLP